MIKQKVRKKMKIGILTYLKTAIITITKNKIKVNNKIFKRKRKKETFSPLLNPHGRLMPLRLRARRDSSANDSVTLKSHSGLTSKKAMLFFSA